MGSCPLLVGGTGQSELVGLIGWARDRRVASGAKQPGWTPPGYSGHTHEKKVLVLPIWLSPAGARATLGLRTLHLIV